MNGGVRIIGTSALVAIGMILPSPLNSGRSEAATVSPPAVQITVPTGDELFATGSLTFTGTATDSSSVSSVSFDVQNRDTRLWLQPGGTWRATETLMPATLSNPGATATTWSAALSSLPSGNFLLSAKAVDPAQRSSVSSTEFGDGPTPTATTPGYLTLLFGRTQWTPAYGCKTFATTPPQPTLLNIAQALHSLPTPRSGVGAVITGRIGASTETCVSGLLYPSWSDLAALRDQYGWSMISASQDYAYMTQLTSAQQRTESCGSLTVPGGLYSRGHPRAWGMFAYPDSQWNETIQSSVVSQCFAYGRTYRTGRNIKSAMPSDHTQGTNSILGGTCAAPKPAPCASQIIKDQYGNPTHYHSAVSLKNLMSVAGDEWVVVQMYRLVTGSFSGPGGWDCSSSDWTQHWTSLVEEYCYNDYLAAVSAIPPNVVTVDPATVAQAWNANPAVTDAPEPVVSSVTPSHGPPAGGTTVTITGSGFTGAVGVAFGSSQVTSFTVNSDSQITTVSTPGTNITDVTVTTNKGISSVVNADQFTYGTGPVVSRVAPGSGPAGGGTVVTISGAGFTNASAVSFGTVKADSLTVVSDTEITVSSPPGSGTVDITVTTPGGTSATSSADQFTNVAAPVVNSVAPGSGPAGGGTVVTLSGTGFTNASTVSFGTVTADSFTVVSDTEITVSSPPGSGTVDITVTTPGGTSATSSADQFTYE
jgi:IPT/TIG domain